MRCTACGRLILTTPAATIASRAGPMSYGPVCARRLRLTPTAAKQAMRLTTHNRRQRPNTAQLDLFAQQACS